MALYKRIISLLPDFLQTTYHSYRRTVEKRSWNNKENITHVPLCAKEDIISNYRIKYNIKFFVETGTNYGDMIWRQRNNFDQIYSIELATELVDFSTKRFRNNKNIKIIQGDSGKKLSDILDEISEPAIIYLDAHYWGKNAVRGYKDCAVGDELPIILKTGFEHIIIINDAHLFNGERDYPTIDSISRYIHTTYPDSKIDIENNCIVIELISSKTESNEDICID